MSRFTRHRRPRTKRLGLTLAEVVVSTISAMTLMAGLTSAIFIASRAVNPSSAVNSATAAGLALDEISTELRSMKRLVSRSSNAITFTADDRSNDLDSSDETIRYSWGGTPGNPLIRTYNGTSTTIIADIYQFSVNYLTTADPNPKRILFVQGNVTGTEATYDNTRVSMLQDWGYTVVRMTTVATTEQANLEAAAACAELVYVSTSVTADDLNTKLKNTPKPVILEELLVADSFGMTTVNSLESSEKQLRVSDNTHYITSQFGTGSVNILDNDGNVPYLSPTLAPGLATYCKDKGKLLPNLAIIERGGVLVDNSPAAGIRIVIPWGGTGINPNDFKPDAVTLWQRSVDWASGKQTLTGVEMTLQLSSSSGPAFYTQAEIIGRVRP